MALDSTHAADRRSWVESAEGHPEFPIQNLPFGVFSPSEGGAARVGVAIGDMILNLSAVRDAGLISGAAADAASGGTLNRLMAQAPEARVGLRRQLSDLLDADGPDRERIRAMADRLLHRADACAMHLPAVIGDYTDFYAGIHHASNVGALFRPDNPLLANYKYVPIGYHGRASSIRPSGAPVPRPSGQRKLPDEAEPTFGPARDLDYELELAAWIGPGNALGEPIGIERAGTHLFGLSILNDWSARDLQRWEYQPLGPFLAKNFLSTVSPWVVTAEALEPFRTGQARRPEGDPAPLAYLWSEDDQAHGAFDIALEVFIATAQMRRRDVPPHRLGLARATDLYWTLAQLIAHHTCNGCNLEPGDMLGTGTISSSDAGGRGSLIELSAGGATPVDLPGGETRTFLQAGDEIIMRAHCQRQGFARIGFGECRGIVTG